LYGAEKRPAGSGSETLYDGRFPYRCITFSVSNCTERETAVCADLPSKNTLRTNANRIGYKTISSAMAIKTEQDKTLGFVTTFCVSLVIISKCIIDLRSNFRVPLISNNNIRFLTRFSDRE